VPSNPLMILRWDRGKVLREVLRIEIEPRHTGDMRDKNSAGAATLEPAHDRSHEHVVDRDTGAWLSLKDYLGDGNYGEIVEDKRVALTLTLNDGKMRYVCPWCEKAMTLASRPIRDRSIRRFYFKHQTDSGECSGSRGQSAAAICARKFAHCKEGALHILFKQQLLTSMGADQAFASVACEKQWRDVDGIRWRQPDVQCQWRGEKVAFEAQLSTTFLHVITQRMAFYERNDGRLLWLFRDLDPAHFRLAEDDIFFSNNRNAFRVTNETVARSCADRRFALECLWHEPYIEGQEAVDRVRREIVYFDQLTFDVSSNGVPRSFYFDYEAAAKTLSQKRISRLADQRDQAVRDELESLFVAYPKSWAGNEHRWDSLRGEFAERGLELPGRIYDKNGPFYLLMVAYSAKRGEVIGSKMTNFSSLANTLFIRHKETLWVFSVMMKHYKRGKEMSAHGDTAKWCQRVAEYRRAWENGDPDFAPNHRFDSLLRFLFPNAPAELYEIF
jgi:hypothetical protein